MQLADNLWLVDNLRASNVYIIGGVDGAAIVDSGTRGSAAAILAELRRAGFDPAQVRALIVTHAHVDHIGSLPELYSATGAPIYAPSGETAAIQGLAPLPHPPGIYGQLFGVATSFLRPVPVQVTHTLNPGPNLPMLPGWHVVSTSGHTLDHISLYQPANQLLIAGDALANLGGLRISPWPFTSDMRRARASVALLAGVPLRSIVFGHGTPLLEQADLNTQVIALAQRSRSR
jgi:glyoxylase-like metal-dependent hydrolase (beta-lactamase superfamily II)